MSETKRHTFPAAHRLSGRRAFARVYAGRARKVVGPLAVHGRPNGLDHARLGLSVSRRVGSAVVRNRIKRLLRDAFRLGRHGRPGGYDVVVVVRPHEPMGLADYQRMLAAAFSSLHTRWEKRSDT